MTSLNPRLPYPESQGRRRGTLLRLTIIALVLALVWGPALNPVAEAADLKLNSGNPVPKPATAQEGELSALPGWDSAKVIDPVVIKDGSTYKMWYTGTNGEQVKWRIGYATSTDGIHWTKYSENPVLNVGPGGAWDSDIVRVNVVLKIGATYHLWYMGNGHNRLGYATSSDGIHWTKYAGNPVLNPGSPGSWENTMVGYADIRREGSIYKMWYTGGDGSGKARIGYATSANGTNWTRHPGNPVLNTGPGGSWDESWVLDPSLYWNGSAYKMWYSGLQGSGCGLVVRTGLASSANGISWTKAAGNPVLDVDPGSWDPQTATGAWVLFDGQTYHMWYHGGIPCGGVENIGYATSTDGITWIKYGDKPVLRTSLVRPIKTVPTDGALLRDKTPTFQWTAVTSATKYRLMVDDNADFSSPRINKVVTSNTFTPALPLSDSLYYWRVRAGNDFGDWSIWSTAWSFTIDSVPPAMPTLLAPANGSTTVDKTPTFDWNSPAGAVQYSIMIDNNADFSSPERNALVSYSTFTPLTPLADGTYYWRVRARDAATNWSPWSVVWSVTIDTTP